MATPLTVRRPAGEPRGGDPTFAYDDVRSARGVMAGLTADGVLEDVDAAPGAVAEAGPPPAATGVVGLCPGGSIALVTAARRPVGAAVTFYGGGVRKGRFGFPPLADEAGGLRAPWLGLFGEEDPSIPVAEVEALRVAARSAPVETEVARDPGAGHGFPCDDRASFHPASAADARARALAWFDRHLAPAP